MIELIPAIDIIEGKCVRLTKGDYDSKRVYGNPLDMAMRFEDLGFRRLHVVDLDGAKSRHVVNIAALREITRRTGLIVDFGGGIKSGDDLEAVFEAGALIVWMYCLKIFLVHFMMIRMFLRVIIVIIQFAIKAKKMNFLKKSIFHMRPFTEVCIINFQLFVNC